MLWVRAFHLIFMVTWFSGIFYLPRLFVYHALSTDRISQERFQIMERKLSYGIILPSSILTLILGVWMLQAYAWALYKHCGWLHLKLLLIVGLIAFQCYCEYCRRQFAQNRNRHSHIFYRWINEIPVIFLVGIILAAVLKPC